MRFFRKEDKYLERTGGENCRFVFGAGFEHCKQTTDKIIQHFRRIPPLQAHISKQKRRGVLEICGDNLARYLKGQLLKNEIK